IFKNNKDSGNKWSLYDKKTGGMMNASQSKGEKDMRYMKTSLTAAAVVILISGFGASEVDASASMGGQSQTQPRSEEHTSELQSRFDLVCRLLLEKKKINICLYTLTYT